MKTKTNFLKLYKFEINDLRALIQVANIILIFKFGVSAAYLGFLIAGIGLMKDFLIDKKINNILIHLSTLFLNYCIIHNLL